jgi:hypothetical protein
VDAHVLEQDDVLRVRRERRDRRAREIGDRRRVGRRRVKRPSLEEHDEPGRAHERAARHVAHRARDRRQHERQEAEALDEVAARDTALEIPAGHGASVR